MRLREHFWEPVSSYSQMSSKYENMMLNYVIQHRVRSLLPTISPSLSLYLYLSLFLLHSLSLITSISFFSSLPFTSLHFTLLLFFFSLPLSSLLVPAFFSFLCILFIPFYFVLISSFSFYLITPLTDVRFHQWPPRSPSRTFQNLTS